MNMQDLAIRFSDTSSYDGFTFDVQLIPGEVEVLQVVVGEFEELPVYVSITDSQLLCIVYLWTEAEVDPKTRVEMLETMLEVNIPMPLSSFSKIGEHYAVFGAMSLNSSFDEIVHEVAVLAENSVDAITAMEGFLV
ncbi:MAG: hypothetical protein COB04_00155 [Gammaproteobacteria bacterium]|nr:MAG: hypothetical protein COB04_00155 [Gammaproteobacteria bacterium]